MKPLPDEPENRRHCCGAGSAARLGSGTKIKAYMSRFLLLVAFVGLMLGTETPVRAQGGTATAHGAIAWGGYAEVPMLNGRRQRVPAFGGAHLAVNDPVGWFSLRLDGAVREGELLNLVYAPVSAADARLYGAAALPTGPDPQLSTGTEMKRAVSHLRVRPVRRSPQTGLPERLVSFDYRYSPDQDGIAARGTLAGRTHAARSVLATGDWYKVGVAEGGIYKLDKTALRTLGLNVQGLNPNNFRLFGNSMGMLPQPNDAYRPDDLMENNILFVGNSDAVFDDNEYFLFYSPGAHTWEEQGGGFRHRNNLYADTTYYFVTAGTAPGRRVPAAAQPVFGSHTATITTFTDRYFHEHDLANLLYSGRNWVGEGFRAGQQKEFAFSNIPDLVPNTPVRVVTSLVASATTPSTFEVKLNGQLVGSQVMDARATQAYGEIASVGAGGIRSGDVVRQLALASPGAELRVGLTFNSGDATASGYLDYIEINAQRQLRLSGAQLGFRSFANMAPGAVSRFVLANATGATVWDVTNPRRAAVRTLDGGGGFQALTDSLREYVAFVPTGSFGAPRPFGKVDNQDLHALNSNPAALLDLIIVTYPPFYGQALRLANHRISRDNMRVAVVTTTQVYNEYGSGGQDVTAIRDLMKQVYDRAPGKYMQLLLFGDGSFDYKSDPANNKAFEPAWWRDRVPFKNDADFDAFNQNYVPTYESRESLAPFYGGAFGDASYSSDDYYALLDDNEGEWPERPASNDLLDIGVGRLPVRTPKGSPRDITQARQMVDKLLSYDATSSFGKWRNRITMIADDGDYNIFTNSAIGSDGLAAVIEASAPAYNMHKVYLDLYPQQAVAAGQRSVEANRAIDQSIEQGSLIVNYLGHGGPKGLADEQIVTNATVMALRNPNNLTFFTTGTCDFSTFDNPDFTSAGEQVLTDNVGGGAVGLFTTTRVVEASLNAGLVKAYFERVLQPVSGRMPTIGQAVMLSKNDFAGGVNNRNYTLLADPGMTLAYPRQTVVLDSVRERVKGAWQPADTLKALARVRIRGHVANGGAKNTAFSGTAQITIYDKPTTVMTLGDENPDKSDPRHPDAPRAITVRESVVYSGQARVTNGEFSLVFVIPKDINYNVSGGLGKISLYAADATNKVDANGFQLKKVGGASTNAPTDTTPPVIALFMDDETFAFGGLTGQNSTLIARLQDESGINTTGAGIGHDITAVLDGDAAKLVVLNDAYVGNVNDFTSGKVNNLFKDLAAGPHSLRFKAWDTYNNSAERDIEFVVANNEKLALGHVLNYPNPFAGETKFFFDHNHAGEDLDVQVQIFTVAGRLVRTLNATVPGADAHQRSISWNGRDDYDDQLARGVYVYRLSVRVRSESGGVASKYEKLVILN